MKLFAASADPIAKLETVAIYDDARIDTGGELSTKLGEMIGPVGS